MNGRRRIIVMYEVLCSYYIFTSVQNKGECEFVIYCNICQLTISRMDLIRT